MSLLHSHCSCRCILVPRIPYAEFLHKTVRQKTRTIMIGDVAVGSEHPIRVQTMTTTDTKDIQATVDQVLLYTFARLNMFCVTKKKSFQVKRIADVGGEICRITVQGKREADACYDIKNTLVKDGYVLLSQTTTFCRQGTAD